MKQLCDELQCPNMFCGDFNAGVTNTFGGVIELCIENDFIIFDYALLPRTHLHTLVMHTTQLLR